MAYFRNLVGISNNGSSGAHTGEIVRAESIAPNSETLMALTATQTSSWTHDITLNLTHPMNVDVVLAVRASTYVGPYTISGPNPAGGTHTEQLSLAGLSGGGTARALKVYGPTGTLTISGPAQSNALGGITVITGRRCGLTEHTVKAYTNTGVLLSAIKGVDGEELAPENSRGHLWAPSATGGKGAYETPIGYEYEGLPILLTFVATT